MKYKLEKLCCPSCGAGIDMDIKGLKAIFCPFCGSQFTVDDGEIVITKNINIHKRYTNDAAIIKEQRKNRESDREYKERKVVLIGTVLFFLVVLLFSGIMAAKDEWEAGKKAEAGMIKAGQSSSEMEGKNYQAVMGQLESAGFTNIVVIDLDDAGLFSNKEDTVDSVSIGGDASFGSSSFFFPDDKVVISYH